MTRLSQTEKERFLSGLHVCVLAIPQPGRGPLLAPIWYDYQPGKQVRFIMGPTSRKAELLAEGTRVSVCVQDEAPPYAYVSIEGPVSAIEACSAEVLKEMAVRYLGQDEGERYAKSLPGAELARCVTVQPDTWLAADFSRR